QLGGVDSGDGREFLRGGGRGAALGQRPERAQIHRQPGHGRLWNGRGAAGGPFAAAARGTFAPGALGTQGGHRAPEGAVAVGLLPERATFGGSASAPADSVRPCERAYKVGTRIACRVYYRPICVPTCALTRSDRSAPASNERAMRLKSQRL